MGARAGVSVRVEELRDGSALGGGGRVEVHRVGSRCVEVKVGGLKRRVEPDLCHGHGWIGFLVSLYWELASRTRDHVLAFQTAAIDAAGEGTGAVPWGVEDIVPALQLGVLAMAVAKISRRVFKRLRNTKLAMELLWPGRMFTGRFRWN